LFVNRTEEVNTSIVLVGTSHGHIDGIDDLKNVQALSKGYQGIIWTDKIEKFSSIDYSNKFFYENQ